MKFEEVLPALRAGKKVRRKDCMAFRRSCDARVSVLGLLADDWEIVPEPKRVADYLVPIPGTFYGPFGPTQAYYKATYEVAGGNGERSETGKQPEGAVLIPGTERSEESREAGPNSEREEV